MQHSCQVMVVRSGSFASPKPDLAPIFNPTAVGRRPRPSSRPRSGRAVAAGTSRPHSAGRGSNAVWNPTACAPRRSSLRRPSLSRQIQPRGCDGIDGRLRLVRARARPIPIAHSQTRAHCSAPGPRVARRMPFENIATANRRHSRSSPQHTSGHAGRGCEGPAQE